MVTLVADRGFADQKFFQFLSETLKFNYVIRIKSNRIIRTKNSVKKGLAYLREDGRAVSLKDAKITLKGYEVKQVVVVKDKGMKAAWILASNSEIKTGEIIHLYAKRWKIGVSSKGHCI